MREMMDFIFTVPFLEVNLGTVEQSGNEQGSKTLRILAIAPLEKQQGRNFTTLLAQGIHKQSILVRYSLATGYYHINSRIFSTIRVHTG